MGGALSERRLTVGAFQFDAGSDPERNVGALERGIRQAPKRGVRLHATQECELCGYPAIEVASLDRIDWAGQDAAVRRVRELAAEYDMYLVVGMMTRTPSCVRNTVRLVTPGGAPAEAVP